MSALGNSRLSCPTLVHYHPKRRSRHGDQLEAMQESGPEIYIADRIILARLPEKQRRMIGGRHIAITRRALMQQRPDRIMIRGPLQTLPSSPDPVKRGAVKRETCRFSSALLVHRRRDDRDWITPTYCHAVLPQSA
jgi:hypothetical protein